MLNDFDIKIRHIILHILDTDIQLPILSDIEHPLENDAIEFVGLHIAKILSDENLKTASFGEGESKVKDVCERLKGDEEGFPAYTSEIANALYDIMLQNVSIPPADLVCTLFDIDGIRHFGILKFNYRVSYIHFVSADESLKFNSIIKQKTALPYENQKVDECILINLESMEMRIMEKKYELDGIMDYYLSTRFLDVMCELSKKEKATIFKKATESFSKKKLKDEPKSAENLARVIAESIDKNEVIDIGHVAESVFPNRPQMREEFKDHMENKGFTEEPIEIDRGTAEKVFRKRRIKTDEGIEISLPYDFTADKMEFINNPDGTVSIVIKNINII